MGKLAALIVVLLVVVPLLACASGAGAPSRAGLSEPAAEPDFHSGPQGPAGPPGLAGEGFAFPDREGRAPAVSAPASTPAPAASAQHRPPAADAPDSGQESTALQTAQRRVISTASLTVEVESVDQSVNRVRAIAEGLGGFVEQLSSSGGANRQQAHVTIRVPQDQFFPALERLEELGEIQNRNVGSEDVSERFIDLEARLRSSLREEESLLNLLGRATQVSEILTIERELNRVRTEIERLQGQLNFLERRVDLATISLSLVPPEARVPQPPSASLVVEQSSVSGRVEEVKSLVSSMNGEVDRVLISVRNGRERADVSFRVFPEDFGQAVEFLESGGEVRSKDLREGGGNPSTSPQRPDSPNAVIGVTLVEPDPSNTGAVIAVLAPLGALALAGVLGVAFFFTYRAGRNRRDRYIQTT